MIYLCLRVQFGQHYLGIVAGTEREVKEKAVAVWAKNKSDGRNIRYLGGKCCPGWLIRSNVWVLQR